MTATDQLGLRECPCGRLFACCRECPEPATSSWCPCATGQCAPCAGESCRYCGHPESVHDARGCQTCRRYSHTPVYRGRFCGEFQPGGHHPAYTRPEGAPRL